MVKQCVCGVWFESQKGQYCPTCRKAKGGAKSHPMYLTWSVHHRKHWPEFLSFVHDVGNPPTPGHWLVGKQTGTKATPGNWKWIPGLRLDGNDATTHDLPNLAPMLFNDEFKDTIIQAYVERQENPATVVWYLEQLEKEYKPLMEQEDKKALQLDLEHRSHEYSKELRKEREVLQVEKGRGSQVRVGKKLREKIVPILALEIEQRHCAALAKKNGRQWGIIGPLFEKLDNDYMLIAHITLSVMMDSIGRGSALSTPLVRVQGDIGERLDDQAFLHDVKEQQPQAWNRIDMWALKSNRGYSNKMKRSKDLVTEYTYEWMEPEDHVKLGNWLINRVYAVTKWFDQIPFWYKDSKNKKRTQYYLGLSQEGVLERDAIQAMQDDRAYQAWPMVCKPYRWEEGKRGGYLEPHFGQVSRLIHNDRGTIPSPNAMEALHRTQEVAYQVNPFIYHVEKMLLAKSIEVGSFKTYEKDSWSDTNRPIIDPRSWTLPQVWDEKKKRNVEHPEKAQARRSMNAFYANQKKAERERQSPMRVLSVAARFLHADEIFLPQFFDSRLRIYSTVDTLSPNGGDWQKALLMFAKGTTVTPENEKAVKRDLLITIANTWGNKEGDIKTDKLTFDGRVAFAEKFVSELEHVARDPLSTSARALWTSASEPFQFLATVRMWWELFEYKTTNIARTMNGRDCTCSGMQFGGAFSKDEAACIFTNVIPSDTPQDMYGEVARHAQALLKSDVWVSTKIAKYTKQTEKRMRKRQEEGLIFRKPNLNFDLTIDPLTLDRSVVKKCVMVTAYNGSWRSKNAGISEELDEVFKDDDDFDVSLTDKRLCTDAAIEGLSTAFPACDLLGDWFKQVGKAGIEQKQDYLSWYTANGSLIKQEYRWPLIKKVKTLAMGGASYRDITPREGKDGRIELSVASGWGEVRTGKHGTALGANVIHSADAQVLQDMICTLNEGADFMVCHDCVYVPAGTCDTATQAFRDCFHDTVTAEETILHSLVKTNKLTTFMPVFGKCDLSTIPQSTYLIS